MSRLLPARVLSVAAAFAASLALCAAASAAALPGASLSTTQLSPSAAYPGLQHLHYEYGPVPITPGQNTIELGVNDLKPDVPGYITRFSPNLTCATGGTICGDKGSVPRVDVIHLHHGVWLANLYPTFAAGEEKTIFNAPQGFGYHYDPSDKWIMNYMIHNLTPNPTSVYITYDIDFLPDSEAAAASVTPVHPLWMDVSGIKPYPVFDALKGQGRSGKFTFPTQARAAQKRDIGVAHQYTASKDMTLVLTAGHVHPGGLYTDLAQTRGSTTKPVFRSVAKYFEPAGAVSWDVSMTATKPDWRVAVKAGDTLNVTATYDTRTASWYESMGIMVVFYADGTTPGAKDPFTQAIDTTGLLTHGHLLENDHHGGTVDLGLPDARTLLNGTSPSNVNIKNFIYGQGDLTGAGIKGRPPVVRAGRSLKFTNLDALSTMGPRASAYHTITACRAPCTRDTGIAYPLADGGVQFDSGELGYGPALGRDKLTPAAQRNTWTTPKDLRAGTYTYFCRIHPFMRGAFRVVSAKK
jgi:plastocyanin